MDSHGATQALCATLATHPDPTTRQYAARVLAKLAAGRAGSVTAPITVEETRGKHSETV